MSDTQENTYTTGEWEEIQMAVAAVRLSYGINGESLRLKCVDGVWKWDYTAGFIYDYIAIPIAESFMEKWLWPKNVLDKISLSVFAPGQISLSVSHEGVRKDIYDGIDRKILMLSRGVNYVSI